jgi:hypothetical protein
VSAEQTDQPRPGGVSLQQVRDGASSTLCVVEADSRNAVFWTKPEDYEPDAQDPLQGLRAARKGGFLGVMCDGSVHFFPSGLAEEVFEAMITKDGEEAAGFPF